jgi:cytochrome bd ubiquinol oxidase subunit I
VAFTRSARLAAWVALAGTVAVMVTGDIQARLMDSQQPMKMAAAEAVYRTQSGASFSLLTIGNLSGQPIFQIRIPHLLSLIATLSWNGRVDGVTSVQHAEALRYGPGSYVPVLWVTYWSFRLMVGLGFVMLIVSAWTLWRSRRGARRAFELGRFTLWLLVACIVTPFAANTFGWLFTEMGRQPWIVYGLMKTGAGISPSVSVTDMALTLGGFVLLYTVLGAIDIVVMYLAARRGLGPEEQPGPARQESAGELIY